MNIEDITLTGDLFSYPNNNTSKDSDKRFVFAGKKAFRKSEIDNERAHISRICVYYLHNAFASETHFRGFWEDINTFGKGACELTSVH